MGRLRVGPAGVLLLLLFSSPLAPGTTRSPSARAVRRELREIYSVHRPDRLDTIDALLQEYAGHEGVLLAAVQKKYGLDEGSSVGHTDGNRGSEGPDSSCEAAAAVVWPNASGTVGTSCDTLHGELVPADFFRPLPGGVDTFVNTYWGRSPVVLKRSVCQPNSNYGGAGLDDLARLFPGAFGSVDAKKNLALLSFRKGDMYVNLQMLYANPFVAYLDGVSMIVNSVDCHWGEAASWALQLRSALPHVFESAPTLNIYLTPPGANRDRASEAAESVQPFPLHNDEQDVYILQISGAKNWRVQHQPSARYKGSVGGGADQPGVPALRTRLETGDMLYIPRHHNHEGWTSEGVPSVSISVTMGYNRSKDELQTGQRHHECQQRAAAKSNGHEMSQRSIVALEQDWYTSFMESQKGDTGARTLADLSRRLHASSAKEARRPKQVVRKLARAVRELLKRQQDLDPHGSSVDGRAVGLSMAALHNATGATDPLETLSICVCLNWLKVARFVT